MKSFFTTLIVLFIAFSPLQAQITLPKLIGDGMILQRDAEVTVWGWAPADSDITVDFLDTRYEATASESGKWRVVMKDLPHGGPYRMTIAGGETIVIDDILVGDVWVAGGQSNMEMPMHLTLPLYGEDIALADYPRIRYFRVPHAYDFDEPHTDLSGGAWQHISPEGVSEVSAVAFFFARHLYELHNVPVGVIDNSMGGSPAEAWMSEEALKSFPVHYEEALRFRDADLVEDIRQSDRRRISAWHRASVDNDAGYGNPEQPWHADDLDVSDWQTMEVPGYWADEDLGPVNGVVWFRKEFDVPASMAGKEVALEVGRVVDADSTFINGVFVGNITYQYPPRWYQIPEGVLREGTNNITVRAVNTQGRGGFVEDKPYELRSMRDTIDLKGEWRYKPGVIMEPLESETFIRWKPLGLYNAMVAPLLDYRIKGVIWYQGESNTGRPQEYADLFPAMIADWRAGWDQGALPFLYVQLANYMEADDRPQDSNWARLREAQLQALSVPNTAMAGAIDVGEWNDIHPLNKKDVGDRLALAARKVAFGEEGLVYSGPVFSGMERQGSKLKLSFEHVGSGLVARGDDRLRHFAIAGDDGAFVWADAEISGDHVVVWSDEVPDPVAVRYAWADNPDSANLYNREGLPAAPFRTDDW
ncbi:sialate O-acetylesterase [Balneolales bacterium ANBcel1]|nr:sialate O-acetylesterase [Balneolales bacterium ANBcel1]